MRSVLAFAAAMLLIAATADAQHLEQGGFAAGVNSEGWSLNSGTGTRSYIVFVRFPKPFAEKPSVLLSLTSIDGAPARDGNVRITLKADNVTRDGFVVKISTWGDSRLAGIEGSWLASGR